MNTAAERRDTHRLYLGPEHAIRFLVKGHLFQNVRITNVSLGGCFAMVSQRDHSVFTQGTVLEQLSFEHPDFPQGHITAHVCYAIGTQSEEPMLEFLGLGIHFLTMSEASQLRLREIIG
ncbi:MAG: PilZ domain-containing protein [Holophaga sp.]|nr:PilZ domain-containing protein [Holophaga sp.]